MAENRKIIALTTDPFNNIYGYTLVFTKLIDFIQKKNNDLDVVLISNDGVCSKTVNNNKFIKIKLNPKSNIFLKGIFLVGSFIKKTWSSDIGTVFVVNGEMPELITACILKFKFKKVYCFVHDDFEPAYRKYGNLYCAIRMFLLWRIKNIIVLNSAHSSIIEKDIKNANCYVIPNPIFVEKDNNYTNKIERTRKAINVFMVGLPTRVKGIEDYYYLAKNMPNDTFYWFCNNIDSKIYKKYKDKVNFRIGLERKEMFKEIERMDLFCSCSYYESFCLPVGEAVLMAIPAIVYLIKEVKLAYRNFIQYVEYKNKNAMLEAIKDFKRGNYIGDVKKAKLLVERKYTLEIASDRFLYFLLR